MSDTLTARLIVRIGATIAPRSPALPDHRPRAPIPLDRTHHFLSEPLPHTDPSLRAWIEHLQRQRTAFRLALLNGGIMLYTHRITTDPNLRGRHWCCPPTTTRPRSA